ncbi:N-formylglutamate amidohydrolase [Paramagnetospirillum marisnigri]|uniref:N-formylglutamate amidohydrolase n=1 Tax=Paramagnetospirillum marisnigri TaxID=1285242 RepID=A0A178MS99_9PROT|nr:N-formylglutamate amidohydrolase [Paramagnetospirillum marisnigri]OAN52723.1 N-formylglutamate amidohydrolase [Paramagnetospirillum marisnigri]
MLTFIPDPPNLPPAFECVEGDDDARVLLVCDHASKAIPPDLGELGLERSERECHVAWDIGAALVTRALAARLGCPAVLAGISRLVIDCNRQPGDPTSIPANSCTVEVPGNRGLSEAEAADRAQRWFWPYHTEIGNRIAHLWRHGTAPAVVAVHSFTPRINGCAPRPWHVGVLWNRDPRMSEPLLAALRARGDLVVGDNQPYSGKEINYTLDTHAGAAGLPNVSFEIRQDLLMDEAGCQRWADLLAEVLVPVLNDPALHRVQVY